MSYSATKVIKINTRISAAGLSTANFGSAVLFVTADDLANETALTPDTYATVSETKDLATYLKTDSEAYEAASVWLGGTPTTGQLMIYRRAADDSSWATTLDKARNQVWWYWTFVTRPVYASETDVKQIAAWCDQNASFFFDCQTDDAATKIRTETEKDDIASQLTALGYRHCATACHGTDPYSGIYLAKHFARVNYTTPSSTITGEYKKSPGLLAEDLKASEYAAMENTLKKACFYAVIDLQGSVDSGRWKNTISHSTYGEWIDDVVNLDAFVNSLAVALYNTIANSTSKVPQTPAGQALLIASAKAVCEQFIDNRYLGARTYTDPDTADEKTTRGYEILTKPEDILTITDSERNNRSAAPMRVRIYRAGAIHAVDVTVDVY